jgi:hypothetical protein
MAFTPDGRLLVAGYTANQVIQVNPDGTSSAFAIFPGNPGGIAVHPVTGDVYVANEPGGTILKYNSTGTSVSTFASSISWDVGIFPSFLQFSADGGTLYFGEVPGHLPNFSLRGITGFPIIEVAAVPEPSSAALCALAAITLCGRSLRRRSAKPKRGF